MKLLPTPPFWFTTAMVGMWFVLVIFTPFQLLLCDLIILLANIFPFSMS